jgi:tetratricopeptide (TPR) repeat protein
MDRDRTATLATEAEEIARSCGDLRSRALLKILSSAVPGAPGHVDEWAHAAEEAIALADESGDAGLRAAIRGAATYPHMFSGEVDRMEEIADEMLAILDGDPDLGAGIVIGSPIAWGKMVKSVALRERGRADEAERLLDSALAESTQRGDPETESWSLGWKSMVLADRGEIEAGLALGLRNCELTERLGDVFSHTVALTSLGYVRLEAGEYAEALEDVERAERRYREAMGTAGESAGWRGTLRALVLVGLGRTDEACREAAAAVEDSRARGINWQVPLALRALAQARAAAGEEGVAEALDEAAAIATRLGHRMTLDKIAGDRADLVAA